MNDNISFEKSNAKIKNVEIAVIYDKYHKYNRKDMDEGLKYYETLNNYRFKEIIVIAQDGKVHKHKHNNI